MPTLLPVRPAIVAEHVHIPTVIASLLAFAFLTTMTVLTPTRYPSVPGTAATMVARHP